MSYPAGEQYEAQTQDEAEESALTDSHPADIQGNIAAEVSSESGHPLADSATELTRESLQEGVDIEEVEKELIRQALDVSEWNQSKAAKKLNIGIDAFRYRMKKFGYLK